MPLNSLAAGSSQLLEICGTKGTTFQSGSATMASTLLMVAGDRYETVTSQVLRPGALEPLGEV